MGFRWFAASDPTRSSSPLLQKLCSYRSDEWRAVYEEANRFEPHTSECVQSSHDLRAAVGTSPDGRCTSRQRY